MENNTVQLLASLLDVDHRWTARELAGGVGFCHKTVHHTLGYRMKFTRCNNSTAMSPCDYDLFAKVKESLEGPNTTQGGQYGTSTKMDTLLVYDAFQTFGKRR